MMSNSGGERGGAVGGGAAPPCGACKFLRRKCVKGCIFAPYFDSEQGTAHFAAVHKVFGASNASKLLMRIPPHHRLGAVATLCYEALARVRDPVYGCVAHIFTLQHQVVNLQAELAYIQARLANLHGASVFGQLTSSRQPPQPPHNPTTTRSLIPATTEAAGTLGCIISNYCYNKNVQYSDIHQYNWSEISSSNNIYS